MTPSPTPSEGEAMLASLRDNIKRIDQCLADLNWRPSRAHLEGARNTMQDALTRAAAQTSGVHPETMRALSEVAILVDEYNPNNSDWQFRKSVINTLLDRAVSPDTPREGEK